jgi:peptide/nickel transport system substrate-binding protein
MVHLCRGLVKAFSLGPAVGQRLTFAVNGGRIVDTAMGSQWIGLGRAIRGKRAGKALQSVVSINDFWFAWVAFKPNTLPPRLPALQGPTVQFLGVDGAMVPLVQGEWAEVKDVRFCLDRARNPKQSWSWTLAAIKKVEAPDPATVRVTLKHPWAPFLSDVSLFDTGIYPEAYFKKVGASYMTAHPIGTGPYMFDSWKRGQYLRLKKNPHYWMADKFPMQYVEYDLIPNDNTRLLKVEAGELDVDNVLPYNLIAQVKNNPSVKVVIDRSTQTNYLVPNHKVAPFGDVKVRQAITHAIDRAALVKAVLYGYGTPANSFMPRGAIDYDPNIPVPSYDPALARKLLSQSSVPHGFTMNFEVGSGDTVGNQTAVIFKSEVAPLGIKVNIKPMDLTTLFHNQEIGKYSFTNNLWTNDIPDPDELVAFSANYASGSWNFFTWYHNPDVSRLSHEAEQTNDAATRKRLYYKIQEIWARDQWFFALYYPPFVNAVSSRVQGFHESPLGYFVLQGVHKT